MGVGVWPEAQNYILENSFRDRSGCLLWQKSKNNAGYGNARWEGKRIGAHVLSFLAFNGEVPKGWQVDHRRSCPLHCVEPRHLLCVTREWNQRLFWRRLRGQMSRRDVEISRILHRIAGERQMMSDA